MLRFPSAASSVDTTKLVDAFDLGIVPPELLSDETNEQAREEKGTVGLLLTLSHFETVQRGLQCCSYRRLGGRGLAVIGTIMALLILASNT